MTEEQQTLEAIKAEIRKLSSANELEVLKIADAFRQAIKSTDGLGMLAFALVGAEMAARE